MEVSCIINTIESNMIFLIIFSFIFFLCILYLRRKKLSYIKIILFSSLLLYIIPVLLVKYEDYEIETKMKKFDTNNDGFYSKSEINYEFEELERDLITDSGSNLFILFGYPICLIYSIIISLIYKISDYIHIKITKQTSL